MQIGYPYHRDMLNSFAIVGICSLNFIHVETDIVVYDKIDLFTQM
jgi:hypothetical protein